MRQVEPQRSQPDKVEDDEDGIREGIANQTSSIRRTRDSFDTEVVLTDDLSELHLSPEVEEVQDDPQDDDDTKSHHVLRSPFDALWLIDDSIAVITARLTILKRQDEGVDDVDEEETCQPDRSDQGIPVSSEELTHGVVGFFREECHEVHRHVEGQEQDKREARDTHHQLTPDRRFN